MMMIRSMATTAVSRVLVRRSHDSRDKKGWRVAMFVLGPTLDNWCSPMENKNSFRLSWFWVKRFLRWKKFIILWEMWLKSLEKFASGHQVQKHFQAAHNLSDSLSCMLLLWETFIRKRFKKMRFSKSLEPAKHYDLHWRYSNFHVLWQRKSSKNVSLNLLYVKYGRDYPPRWRTTNLRT